MARKLATKKKTTKKRATKKRTTKKRATKKAATKKAAKTEEVKYADARAAAEAAHEKFLLAKDELEGYMGKPNVRGIVQSLRSLIADYNAALDRVKHELRAAAKGRGPKTDTMGVFKVTRIKSLDFDIDTILEAVTLKELEEVGAVKTEVKYKWDDKKLLDLVASEELPEEVYKSAMEEKEKTPRVSTPYKEKAL